MQTMPDGMPRLNMAFMQSRLMTQAWLSGKLQPEQG